MENPAISHHTSPKIALIIPYIGPLPPYFPIWLESAKANPDVDFLFYTDQDVQIDAPNFRVTKTTLQELRQRFERKINRPVSLPNAYKLCDYKPMYGLFFEEELRGYDFWGHCDIDLVFGQIRRFLTDELLSAYDRFYPQGHLSVYRNNEKMRRAFELPGAWFTLKETFGPIHIGFDEAVGINRIFWKHHIPWHTDIDFVDMDYSLPDRLNAVHGMTNYETQIFYYLDGHTFQRYVDQGEIKEREVIYIHWYRKHPDMERLPAPGEAVVVTARKLLVRSPQDLSIENMRRWNPPQNPRTWTKRDAWKLHWQLWYRPFFTGSFAYKKSWLKQKAFRILEVRLKKFPYP